MDLVRLIVSWSFLVQVVGSVWASIGSGVRFDDWAAVSQWSVSWGDGLDDWGVWRTDFVCVGVAGGSWISYSLDNWGRNNWSMISDWGNSFNDWSVGNNWGWVDWCWFHDGRWAVGQRSMSGVCGMTVCWITGWGNIDGWSASNKCGKNDL
jgi:hypothetical protein